MANTKLCVPCALGNPSECIGRWQAPSSRLTQKGNVPKRESYSYKCPNREN